MDDKKIGTSRLNIDTDNKSGYNFSNIKILEDWLNIETLSYDEQFDGDFYNISNKDILLDLFLMKHPETQKKWNIYNLKQLTRHNKCKQAKRKGYCCRKL